MSVDITIRVPDELGRKLQQFQDRLPEVLERGLREVLAESDESIDDETTIIRVLASQPTPDQVLAMRPSAAMQSRVSDLLTQSKNRELTRAEDAELERCLILEHLVRLAKARALEQLATRE